VAHYDVQMRMQAVHRFPVPVALAAAAIGTTQPALIGGVSGTIDLPRPPLGTYTPDGPWPRLQPPTALVPALITSADQIAWGAPHTIPPPPTPIEYCFVEACLLSFEVDANEANKLADAIRAELGVWTARLSDWLQAHSNQPLSAERPPVRTRDLLSTTQFYVGDATTPTRIARDQAGHTAVFFDANPAYASSTQWAMAVTNASAKKDLPLEYRFLCDAFTALRAFDFRRSLLDSATAVELVAANLLETELKKFATHQGLQDFIVRRFDSLDGTVQVLRALSVTLTTDNYAENLSRPRAKAIHAGEQPTHAVARRAFDLATKIVQTHSPLPLSS
jgi:hypothetical protein